MTVASERHQQIRSEGLQYPGLDSFYIWPPLTNFMSICAGNLGGFTKNPFQTSEQEKPVSVELLGKIVEDAVGGISPFQVPCSLAA